MAGIQNNIEFANGFKLQPSSATDISNMQMLSTDVSKINHTGNPEGVISANPSSLSHDPVSGIIYIKETGTGNTGWAILSTSTTTLKTLSDDVGTIINPSAGNIQLVGHVVEQGATKFSTVVQGSAIANINPMSASRWIVDPLGFNGTHTTIQAAITAATSGDTIQIMVGTYTENLTLKAGVNLTAFSCDALSPNVIIKGKLTATFAGTCAISGINLQTNSDYCLEVTGSAATIIELKNCFINALNNTAINHTVTNGASFINIRDCAGNIATTGIAYFTSTSTGAIIFYGGSFNNVGGSTTASTFNASSGGVSFYNCFFNCPITVSGAGGVFTGVSSQFYAPLIINSTVTTSNYLVQSVCSGGTSSSISIGASATLIVANCTIDSTNTNAITGSGTLKYGLLAFTNTSSTVNTSTQTALATLI